VFAFLSEPVGLGIVESAPHPGGNFTGITYSEAPLGGKRLELLVDALPGTKRVGVLWSPHPEVAAFLENIRRSGSVRGIEIFSREIRDLEDLPAAFGDARQEGAQGVIFMGSNLTFGYRKEIAELEISNHLPAIHSFAVEVGPILTPEDVVRRIAAECVFVDERGAVGIRLKPAAAIVRQYETNSGRRGGSDRLARRNPRRSLDCYSFPPPADPRSAVVPKPFLGLPGLWVTAYVSYRFPRAGLERRQARTAHVA
jgi:hypothetical protein